jgi:NAD+ synthase
MSKPAARTKSDQDAAAAARPESLDTTELAVNAELVEAKLVGFLRSEVRRVGFEKVVVGMSGGVDSSLVAALAAMALGPENVVGVAMPYRTSSPSSLADAGAVAERFQIDMLVIDISLQVDAYFEKFSHASPPRRGNKMARERMTVLYDQAAAHEALVVGTSNKTELLLGYGTIFGDMASALNPLGDLYKTQVWQLAAHVGLPEQVITKAPSADLWQGQSDETELGFAYAAVDRLLFHLIDRRARAEELVEMGHDRAFVETVLQRVRLNQYKRRPPLIAKLSNRTIDRDFRYPRDWGT